jgi:hypothetical protein
MNLTWKKPVTGEYLPYQLNYINRVPDGDLIQHLENQLEATILFIKGLPEDKLNYRYAEGKWTIKQILQHLIDTERIMSYRALTFARNDKNELPGFEENDYAEEANADDRSPADLIDDFRSVRHSTLCLFGSFTNDMLGRSGIANKGRITVNSIAYVIAGHELHHMAIIRERYL